MIQTRSRALTGLALVLMVACNQTHTQPVAVPTVGESASALIDENGGEIVLGEMRVVIPRGAVAEPTMITVMATTSELPSWLTPRSPTLRFEPSLTFAEPVELRIPFSGHAETATIFATQHEGGSLIAQSTRIEGSFATTRSLHLHQAVVGTACQGEDCCSQANGKLDVLLVIDNSNSMEEEQASLHEQLPRFARALASGDVDGDGTQDFPALESVRIGVVTTDMGVGASSMPSCDAPFGDDGILRTTSGDPECTGSFPNFAEIGADASPSELDNFVLQVGCVANVGIGGCGFEQQLDSALKAVTPSSSDIVFYDSTTGHGTTANAGFLREDSMLAIVVMSDEDDCSAADSDIFNPESSRYGGVDLNLRCHFFPEAVHPLTRYVDGFLALRTHPADVIFAPIVGASPEALANASGLDALLADPSMTVREDPTSPGRLRPSCEVPGVGTAFPPGRIVGVAHGLEQAGAHAVVSSICQSDFTPAIDAILRKVAARGRGECR